MRKRWINRLAVALVGLGFAGTAQAQVFTPTFQSPRLLNEVGIYLSDGPGSLALEGIWRGGPLGLRLGYIDFGDGLLSVGGELRNPLPVTGAPLGLAFTAAAQGLLGDTNTLGLHAGLTAGYSFVSPGLSLTPYLHPRVGIVNLLRDEDDLDVRILADVGLDVEFWNNILVRLGIKLDDIGSDWGVGIGLRR